MRKDPYLKLNIIILPNGPIPVLYKEVEYKPEIERTVKIRQIKKKNGSNHWESKLGYTSFLSWPDADRAWDGSYCWAENLIQTSTMIWRDQIRYGSHRAWVDRAKGGSIFRKIKPTPIWVSMRFHSIGSEFELHLVGHILKLVFPKGKGDVLTKHDLLD